MSEDYTSQYLTTTGGDDDSAPSTPAKHQQNYTEPEGKARCILVGVVTALIVLVLIPLILNLNNNASGWYGVGSFKVKSLYSCDACPAVMAPAVERMTDDPRVNDRSSADLSNVLENYNRINMPQTNLVAPAKSGYSNGMNTADSGSNRFASSQSNANQEGSLWTKPSANGAGLERFDGRSRMANSDSKWKSKYSESGLDPNSMYVENNASGQELYDWGYTPARDLRGKTDNVLISAAQGL
jgi:hypothetical protein